MLNGFHPLFPPLKGPPILLPFFSRRRCRAAAGTGPWRRVRLSLEQLEDRLTPAMPSTVITVGPTVANLITALQTADNTSGGAVLQLPTGATYTLTAADNGGGTPEQNNWYGPDGLPGHRQQRLDRGQRRHHPAHSTAGGTPNFRLFYVSGGEELPAGTLTLQYLTLANGSAMGGMGDVFVSGGVTSGTQFNLIIGAGPGGGPQVIVVDGADVTQLANNSEIASRPCSTASTPCRAASAAACAFGFSAAYGSSATPTILTGAGPAADRRWRRSAARRLRR